jgi:hypothetical protein
MDMVHIIPMNMNIAQAIPIGISHGSIRPAEQARTGRSPREDVGRPNPPKGNPGQSMEFFLWEYHGNIFEIVLRDDHNTFGILRTIGITSH